MGIVVFFINFEGQINLYGAITAAAKQAAYTFFLGGFFMKQCENLAIRINPPLKAHILAVVIPSTITLLLTFSVHSLRGTPKPIESTLPTLLIIPATTIWAYRKRKSLVHTKEINPSHTNVKI